MNKIVVELLHGKLHRFVIFVSISMNKIDSKYNFFSVVMLILAKLILPTLCDPRKFFFELE